MLFIMACLYYMFNTIISISKDAQKLNKYTENEKIYNENIARLMSVSQTDIQNKSNALNNVIPSERGDITSLMNKIITTGEKYGLVVQQDVSTNQNEDTNNKNKTVSLSDIVAGDIEKIPDNLLISGLVYPFSITMNVKGNKESLLNFFNDLYNMDRLINPIQINMNSTSMDSKDWNAKIQILSYAVYENKLISVTTRKITDPLDIQLETAPKVLLFDK